MMASNEKSFIDRYLECTPAIGPYRDLRAELDGMAKGYKMSRVSPPPWFDTPVLALKIHRAQVQRYATANPWSTTVCQHAPRRGVAV